MMMKGLFLANLEKNGKACLMRISNMKSTTHYMMIILKGKKLKKEMIMISMILNVKLSMIKNTIQVKSELDNKSQVSKCIRISCI
jgi:hypothetical protein